MQKRLVLVCEGSLCFKKLSDVSGPGLGEAGRYKDALTISRMHSLSKGCVREICQECYPNGQDKAHMASNGYI